MGLTTQDSQGLTLQAAIRTFVERKMPSTHLRGYFTPQTYDTQALPIEVQRGTDYVAVDVLRGTGGNANGSSVSTTKTIIPPFYHETFQINGLSAYERVFGQTANMTTTGARKALANQAAKELQLINDKIVRAEELQCAQALETGIVTLKNGANIDYKRKAASKVDLGDAGEAGYWTNPNAKIEKSFQKGGEFIREEGVSDVTTIDATMSTDAWIALKETTWFKDYAKFVQVSFLDISAPKARRGATLHGRITAGSFIYNIWTYNGRYTDANGVVQRFIDPTKVVLTPSEGGVFELAYGAVDTVVKSSGASNVSGMVLAKSEADYYVWDSLDLNNLTHTMHMSSAPVARLISVDQVYTMKVAVDFTSAIAQ